MSPPCGRLSKLQTRTPPNSWRDVDKIDSEVKLAIGFIGLCLEVVAFQIKGGRYFVVESSSSLSNWKFPEMIDFVISCLPFMMDPSTCRFQKKDLESNMFFGRDWRFMTNVEEISQELDRECLGGQQVVKQCFEACCGRQKACLCVQISVMRPRLLQLMTMPKPNQYTTTSSIAGSRTSTKLQTSTNLR